MAQKKNNNMRNSWWQPAYIYMKYYLATSLYATLHIWLTVSIKIPGGIFN